jgi:hypothetical protein
VSFGDDVAEREQPPDPRLALYAAASQLGPDELRVLTRIAQRLARREPATVTNSSHRPPPSRLTGASRGR